MQQYHLWPHLGANHGVDFFSEMQFGMFIKRLKAQVIYHCFTCPLSSSKISTSWKGIIQKVYVHSFVFDQ